MIDFLPPALILLLGALLIGPTRGALRTAVVLLTPLLTLAAVWQVPDGVSLTFQFLQYPIEPIEGSPVRRLFATIFALMAFGGGLYAYRQAKWFELAAAYAYAAGAIGVSFAGDLITLFLFWELMALFSTVVVWCGGTPGARAAGIRYAVMHLLGGVILKVGIEGVMVHTGSIEVQPMLADTFDHWMILVGILINAAAPPVSAWLSDAYPRSSPTGSVFLSAFTTKTAVLALILLFPGEPVLIGIGLFMVMYGIIYALLENDIRRILAFSIVNQVGFMVCAIGIGTQMAINGAAAHAFAHIIYKALLFMSAGVVVYRTGKNRCSDVGGLFRTMPLTAVCGIVGALAISGFPLTSGFTTKTMISQAAANESLVWVYFLLAAASAGVFLHAGIKFPWFVFFQRDSGLRPKDAPWNMAVAMVFFAALCILFGVAPQLLYAYLPYPVEYEAYTASKVVFYLQLLLFSGLAFFLLLPLMKRTETISLDTDWLWRVVLQGSARGVHAFLTGLGRGLSARLSRLGLYLSRRGRHYFGLNSEGDRQIHGIFARAWPIGTTALWIAVLLTAYVFFYYLA
ncbi:MAG: Na(+)/H(+) antiporter subunit D [Xanthomonadales bacterium]|nr:Na(+)/H(+) antiporter subunit D [Gammaproteobacteria bacterium]MBT8054433.1 Na(+)/H(+) antiporter subunit D [Gammaproteobacteria bacterium]NND58447.1 Na(+)/H(+) antiporter subunit D [Xanthomonadales bacterium]NNK50132.1 Na(+)/H(+) antiporter subunit D [Xanthomonadales bacterium]